jgi:ABC-2 type transport system ATP-binding protein
VIEVKDLTKRYGKHLAVNAINFRVDSGEVVGFLGPNGAGKSTTMNIITGYLSATEGTVAVDGIDVLEDPEGVKSRLGYLPEQPPLYVEMTVTEYLNFVARIKKVPKAERGRMDTILERVGIAEVKGRRIDNLSKGYRQRVGLAQALVGNPKVLVLDEPTIGLDPHQIIDIRNLIKELGQEHTIVLSSHILPEVSAVCDRIVIISQGRLVASDTPDNLARSLAKSTELAVRVRGLEADAVKILSGVKGVESAKPVGTMEPGTVDINLRSVRDIDIREGVFRALTKADLPLLMMKSLDLTLEDIFLQLTTREER